MSHFSSHLGPKMSTAGPDSKFVKFFNNSIIDVA